MNSEQVGVAAASIESSLPSDAIVATYLYGSALAGGLRLDSDLDLALVTARRLTAFEKERLFTAIRPLSRRSLRPGDWRPLEVTVLALPDVRPWRYPPQVDAQYGEWLSDTELDEQVRRGPVPSPDVAVLITMLRQTSRPYLGQAAEAVLPQVPFGDLRRATLDAIPSLLADLEGDTRNVLFTLARMWATMATASIRSKDYAAEWAAEQLPTDARRLLEDARRLYLDGGRGEWAAAMPEVRRLSNRLAEEVRRAAETGRATGRGALA